jgi:hypothetical protein
VVHAINLEERKEFSVVIRGSGRCNVMFGRREIRFPLPFPSLLEY